MGLRRLATALFVTAVALPAVARESVVVDLEWERGGLLPAMPRVAFTGPVSTDDAVPAGWEGASITTLDLPAGNALRVLLDDSPGAERVLVDANADGDLSDETPLAWERDGLVWRLRADVDLPGRRARRIPIGLELSRHAFLPHDQLEWRAGLHRWGATAFDGRLCAVGLEDQDGDLDFSPDDVVFVDVSGDGQFDVRPGSREVIREGETFTIGSSTYRLGDVVASGSRVVFVRLWGSASGVDRLDVPPPPPVGVVPTPDPDGYAALVQRLDEARDRSQDALADVFRRLGTLSDERAARLLLRSARDDPSRHVRAAAAAALVHPAHREVVGEDLAALASAPPPIGPAVMASLHRMGYADRAAVYEQQLRSTVPELVGTAAEHLAFVGDRDARLALVKGYRAAPGPSLAEQVYRGLRRLPDGPPAVVMRAAATSHSDSLTAMALRDLHALGDRDAFKLAVEATGRSRLGPAVARACLPPLCERSSAESVAALVRLSRVERVAEDARRSLQAAATGATAVHLWPALVSDDPRDRALAAEILGVARHRASADRLRHLVQTDDDESVREAALTALARLGDDEVLGALGDLLVAPIKRRRELAVKSLARPRLREVDEAHGLIARLLGASLWKTRVAALRVVTAWEDPRMSEAVQGLLSDDHYAVREAAALALGELRPRDAVRPMIRLLRDESSPRVRAALARALFRTTGVNLYDDHLLWTQWWQAHGETFRVPGVAPELPPADAGGTVARTIPRFYGVPIESDSVLFVMDRSSSMEQADAIVGRGRHRDHTSRFQKARDELLGAVDDMPDGARVNVILFDDGVHLWRRSMTRLNSATRTALRNYLESQRPTGATNLYDALERGLALTGVEAIVLLSDGEPNRGGVVAPGEIAREVRELNRDRGVIIHGVSIGRDSGLLRRLAGDHEGAYVKK